MGKNENNINSITEQDNTELDNTELDNTEQDNTEQDNTEQDNTEQDNTEQDNTEQNNTKEDSKKQDRKKQDRKKEDSKKLDSKKEDYTKDDNRKEDNRKDEEAKDKKIEDFGQVTLNKNKEHRKINLISIIGEIEGHEALPLTTKTTKYEHLLPQLAELEDSDETEGILFLINTVGGDVSAGLALAEMIASLSKPTVSLVLGDSHSIGVPLAVATDYSFIVPTGTMIIHPVRMNGTIIGAPQTFDYFKIIQDRIVGFISNHSKCRKQRIEQMMMNTGVLSKDLGTILVGKDAVMEGLINEVGGIKEALQKIKSMIV